MALLARWYVNSFSASKQAMQDMAIRMYCLNVSPAGLFGSLLGGNVGGGPGSRHQLGIALAGTAHNRMATAIAADRGFMSLQRHDDRAVMSDCSALHAVIVDIRQQHQRAEAGYDCLEGLLAAVASGHRTWKPWA
jgi:hypothetical protein